MCFRFCEGFVVQYLFRAAFRFVEGWFRFISAWFEICLGLVYGKFRLGCACGAGLGRV